MGLPIWLFQFHCCCHFCFFDIHILNKVLSTEFSEKRHPYNHHNYALLTSFHIVHHIQICLMKIRTPIWILHCHCFCNVWFLDISIVNGLLRNELLMMQIFTEPSHISNYELIQITSSNSNTFIVNVITIINPLLL